MQEHSYLETEALLEAAFDPIVIHENGIGVEVNAVFTNVFGFQRDEVIGKDCIDLIAAPQVRQKLIDYCSAPSRIPFEIILRRKDGTLFLAEVRARRMVYHGRAAQCLCVRKSLEAYLKAEAAADYLERVHMVAAALLDALTVTEVARIFTDVALSVLNADHGSLSLQIDEQTFEVIHTSGLRLQSPTREKWVRYPNDLRLPLPNAVRHGEAQWFSTAAELVARYPSMQVMLSVLPGATVVLPLRVRDRILGGLSFGFVNRTGFDEEERRFILTLGNYCAQALDRALLYEAEKQARLEAEAARQQTAQLQALTAALSESLTPHQVAEVVLDSSFELFNVSLGSVVVITDDGEHLEVLATKGYPPAEVAPWQRFPISAPTMFRDCLKTGEGVWVSSREDLWSHYPEFASIITKHYESWMALPLIVDGLKIGALGFNFDSPQTFEPAAREFMMTVAHYCAQAVQRARLYQAEADARAKAEAANQTKNRFLAMLSHELRTPLTAILGFSSALADAERGSAVPARALSTIFMEAQRMASLVEQLLDLARLQAGVFNAVLQPVTVSDLFSQAEEPLKLLAANHHLSISAAHDLPPVLADRSRITQVLTNLVQNAALYSPPGTNIDVSADLSGAFVRFHVRDAGTGIPVDYRPYIFEAFRRLATRTNANQKGLGLGLAICKGIVEAHGGQIEVADNPPSGTTVTFSLRVAPSAAEPHGAAVD